MLLFSLQARPAALSPVVGPVEFDQDSADKIARQIAEAAPSRTPGSNGDAAIADLVEKRFTAISEGQVAEQSFGDGLRNVILTLPGASPRSIVLMAGRDSAGGPGAASSAAATGTLLELADELQTSRRSKTLVFVSTDGASDGAVGAREFAEHFPQRDLIDGTIVLWQPGSATPRQPSLLDASDGSQSASDQLVRTADRALTEQTGHAPQLEGTLGQVAGLAFPTGLGEQAPLIEQGIDAIGISSAGERPLPEAEDQPDDLSADTLGDFGRTALLLVATLDSASTPLVHGPSAYLILAGNIVPGWALTLLGLSLLLPALLVAIDGLARAFRRRQRIGWALGWAAARGLPPLAALVLLYLLAITGIVAKPAFPFDPNRFTVGPGQVVAMVVLGIVIGGGYYVIRGWRVPAGLAADVAAPALGMISALGVLLAFLANPYLALLLVPVAHVWLLSLRRHPVPAWPLALGAATLSLLPIVIAAAHVTGRLDLGSGTPWQLLLMVDDGQIGFGEMLSLCLLVGSLVGVVALAARPPERRTAVPMDDVPPWPTHADGEASSAPADGDLDTSPIAPDRADDDLVNGA